MSAEVKQSGSVAVVIPAFREERHIGGVVRAVRAEGFEAVVVDDGSDDRTAEVAGEAGAVVIRHDRNQGKGVALQHGFEYAAAHGYEAAVTLDADGQHRPEEIRRFVEAYGRGDAPVLIGNRMADTSTMPLIRRWTNRFMSWLLSRLMGQAVPDTQCGFRLYRLDAIPPRDGASERFDAESEILLEIARRGVRIGSVPISTVYGEERSKVNPWTDTIRFFRMLRRYRRERA
ncbi:MAG TPA: glycosyltransferase family 2 protein [Kiritimatiellia bacterium]|nr:glycosyltransferase family 2 protein [Kiritimatiellia bacterium]HRZ13189.1 glycosyltransferase family 2 protein [Kiritimatiellia bacterium]HSA19756.1 glycosyltransferase family 2 protein [Kiritimatiellia bacterium]